jgi:hypothetical protein
MSLPYTNDDVLRSHRMNVRYYNACNRIRAYFTNFVGSTKNAAKLLCASVTSCIHGVFPSAFKYTALSICLSIVENDLTNNNNITITKIQKMDNACAHPHDV